MWFCVEKWLLKVTVSFEILLLVGHLYFYCVIDLCMRKILWCCSHMGISNKSLYGIMFRITKYKYIIKKH